MMYVNTNYRQSLNNRMDNRKIGKVVLIITFAQFPII